ncbi:MBL fold metallo-hydrolase [Companilactobacillus furfuricola]|uniref:MBL fold metallo-hydrolase n=1 Tax=Companilactobacillus furfuricola TaxID=1462575 RepID=UPI000F78DE39|nr:MBL fold metallo-hydrolase [Companilactobacillus furfuricola]
MKATEIRNATVKLQFNGTTFLIDPMLADKGTYEPMSNQQGNTERNPIVELPMSLEEILDGVDAVIVTHDHIDHWDQKAEEVIDKEMPIFVQGEPDRTLIVHAGFKDVRILDSAIDFHGVRLQPTQGKHYENNDVKDVLEKDFNTSKTMGVLFTAKSEKSLFFTGDTIWFDGLKESLEKYQPELIVVNAGGNGFKEGRLILDQEDVLKIHQLLPSAKLIASHMDAVNHGTVTRSMLKKFAQDKGFDDSLLIPSDGETWEA